VIGRALFTFWMLAGTAAAQSAYVPLGSRIPVRFPPEYRDGIHDVDPEDPASVGRALQTFARCKTIHHREGARAVTDLPFESDAQHAELNRFFARTDACLGSGASQMAMSSSLIVGSMAEAFVLNDPNLADTSSIGKVSEEGLKEGSYVARSLLEEAATCAVRSAPEPVFELIHSPVNSPEEMEAIQKMVPFLSPCIPEGVETKFNRASIRALLAAGTYTLLANSGANLREQSGE